jgi:4-carboxymuconolactone decarboxylase
MPSEPRKPSARDMIGELAPKFTDITDHLLFDDIWERSDLSKRDRSLITVAALVALNRTQQLGFHLQRALDNGVTKDELVEAITHLAFYSGWPTAMSALMLAKDILPQQK